MSIEDDMDTSITQIERLLAKQKQSKPMTAKPDLLPLRDWMECLGEANAEDIRDYTRANLAELQREVEGLREYKRISDECNESLRTFVKVEEARTAAAEARAERLAEALRWYAEQAAGCRKLGRDGDAARAALDADGGGRARAALEQEAGHEQ